MAALRVMVILGMYLPLTLTILEAYATQRSRLGRSTSVNNVIVPKCNLGLGVNNIEHKEVIKCYPDDTKNVNFDLIQIIGTIDCNVTITKYEYIECEEFYESTYSDYYSPQSERELRKGVQAQYLWNDGVIYYEFDESAQFLGPFDNIWSDSACTSIGSYQNKSLPECMAVCLNTTDCTAINFRSDSPADCNLRGCSVPVPQPQESSQHYQGYAISTGQFIGPFNKIWSTIECPHIITHSSGFSLRDCKAWCESVARCTTIDFLEDLQYCVLRECSVPVPHPQGNSTSFQGYKQKKTGQYIEIFNKPLSTIVCPKIIVHILATTLDMCKMWCGFMPLCSAVNHWEDLQLCVLRECSETDPQPQGHNTQFQGYALSSDLDKETKSMIIHAMEYIENQTCIRFQHSTNPEIQHAYIHYSGPDVCQSYIGRNSGIKNHLFKIGTNCNHFAFVLHELTHLAGVFHEYQRTDRDDFVYIREKTVMKGSEVEFKKVVDLPGPDNPYDIEYDFSSVMHYSSRLYTSDGKHTILTKNPFNQQLIDRYVTEIKGYSHRDKHLLNKMYNCINKWVNCSATEDPCVNGGYLGPDCACICQPGTEGQYCNVTVDTDYYGKIRQPYDENVTCAGVLETLHFNENNRNLNIADMKSMKWVQAPECKRPKLKFLVYDMNPSDISPINCSYYSLFIRFDINGDEIKICSLDDIEQQFGSDRTITSDTSQILLYTRKGKYDVVGWRAELSFENESTTECQDSTSKDPCETNAAECDPQCEHGACKSPNNCTCDPGYEGAQCQNDIDECLYNNGGCNQTCNNTNGSFVCSCGWEFILGDDQNTCEAVEYNEATGNIDSNNLVNFTEENFNQIWVLYFPKIETVTVTFPLFWIKETEGELNITSHDDQVRYMHSGRLDASSQVFNTSKLTISYRSLPNKELANDTRFIIHWDALYHNSECNDNNGGCNQICNYIDSYSCSCYQGYTIGGDKKTCQAVEYNETTGIIDSNNLVNFTEENFIQIWVLNFPKKISVTVSYPSFWINETEGELNITSHDDQVRFIHSGRMNAWRHVFNTSKLTISYRTLPNKELANDTRFIILWDTDDGSENTNQILTDDGSENTNQILTGLPDKYKCNDDNGGCNQNCIFYFDSNWCSCYKGYTLGGDTKTCQAECDPQCEHGACKSPNNCTCEPGYEGIYCQNAECDPQCEHGACKSPNNCTCDPGYEGIHCQNEKLPVTEMTGFCTSPGFPNNYPIDQTESDTLCHINIPSAICIILEIHEFKVEKEETCTNDYLIIRYGGCSFKYCGHMDKASALPTIAENYVTLSLKSDHSDNDKGYNISWTGFDQENAKGCIPTYAEPEGTILSPVGLIYPVNYPANANENWEIHLPSQMQVKLTFEDFELEGRNLFDQKCYDYLKIWYGITKPVVEDYCVKELAETVKIYPTNWLKLHFYSDETVQEKGFNISWNSVETLETIETDICSGTDEIIKCFDCV